MLPDTRKTFADWLSGSIMVRASVLFGLILVLQIPVLAIRDLTSERIMTRNEAREDVMSSWGSDQVLGGPALIVPYRHTWINEHKIQQTETRYVHFLPEQLKVRGHLATQMRQRGIFAVPLYTADLEVSGSFARPSFDAWDIQPEDIVWKNARLVLGVADAKAIRESITGTFAGQPLAFGPGKEAASYLNAGVSAPLPLSGDPGSSLPFTFTLRLGGANSLQIQPSGVDTQVELTADWPDPSFIGSYLPASAEVTDAGFNASWSVPHLGRNYPQQWLDTAVTEKDFFGTPLGVSLLPPVDAYRMSERAVKYELMFFVLTFLAFFLFEMFAGRRVHPIQYLLVGSALCLFYLLTLSLAEHLGFGPAYLLATLANVMLIGSYSTKALASKARGAMIAAVLGVLYGFLYVLLSLKDHSLLIGTLGLFVILSLVMYITRNVDWQKGLSATNQG